MSSSSIMNIPTEFGVEFIEWFRQRTQEYWAHHEALKLADWKSRGVGGVDWQKGTCWLNGLTDEQIDNIEKDWSLRFPPDYRLFLRHLHSVDRPMVGALSAGEGDSLESIERPSFYNWLTDDEAIQERLDELIEGLEFDIEHNELWLDRWGEKPAAAKERRIRLRKLISEAPKVIPLFSHRYLLAEPCQSDNPVFSINQSDITIYGCDLRTYLLHEFAEILGISKEDISQQIEAITNTRFKSYLAIPFWGKLLA